MCRKKITNFIVLKASAHVVKFQIFGLRVLSMHLQINAAIHFILYHQMMLLSMHYLLIAHNLINN